MTSSTTPEGEPRDLTLADFDFNLPPALIAQHPLGERSASRLLDGTGAAPREAAVAIDIGGTGLKALVVADAATAVSCQPAPFVSSMAIFAPALATPLASSAAPAVAARSVVFAIRSIGMPVLPGLQVTPPP